MRAYTQFYSRLKGGGTKPEELCMSMKKEEDNFCVEQAYHYIVAGFTRAYRVRL